MSSPANTTAEVLAVVSLGSNLGLPTDLSATAVSAVAGSEVAAGSTTLLGRALDDLRALSESALIVSSLYQTAPVECPAGVPDFINAIALLRVAASIPARELLQRLHAIEARYGRMRDGHGNQPRTLDLDLIACGNMQCDESDITLPHPRAHTRGFVMIPLAEVAPGFILPGQSATAAQLAAHLSRTQQALLPVRRL